MNLRVDAINPEVYWDAKSRKYRWTSTKRFASKRAVLALTQRYITTQQAELRSLGQRYTSGNLRLRDFQEQAAAKLKAIYISQAVLGRDGHENLTVEDFLTIARELKRQYHSGLDPLTGKRYGLKWLCEDLAAGKSTPAQFLARLNMFGRSGKSMYWAMREKGAIAKGATHSVRKRNSRESCGDCIAYAALGVQPIGILPQVGQRCACGVNCLCSIRFGTLEELVKRSK